MLIRLLFLVTLVKKYPKWQPFWLFFENFQKSVDGLQKISKIRTRWQGKAQRSSLTNSLDNLCGHSAGIIGRLEKKEVSIRKTAEWTTKQLNSLLSKKNKLLNWRVWSWLRLNAGGRLNTCKSNGSSRKACFSGWRVADGWVIPGKLPIRGGQHLETGANTA